MKAAIVVADGLSLGLVANTVGVLSLSLGHHVDLIGPDLADSEGSKHSGLTMIPLPILKTDADKLIQLRQQAQREASLFLVDVTNAARTTTNYPDYATKLINPPGGRLEYLGIAVFGPRKLVSRLTGSLPLYR
jgi:hypothetical protein